MNSRFNEIIEQLRAEEADLQSKMERLRSDMKFVENELSQVRKAIGSLKGKNASTRSNNRAAATKEQIVESIYELLQSRGALPETELKQLVQTELTEQGKSRSGFAICFQRAVNDKRFVRNGTDISIAGQDDQAGERFDESSVQVSSTI